jgi:hypothetical protein
VAGPFAVLKQSFNVVVVKAWNHAHMKWLDAERFPGFGRNLREKAAPNEIIESLAKRNAPGFAEVLGTIINVLIQRYRGPDAHDASNIASLMSSLPADRRLLNSL